MFMSLFSSKHGFVVTDQRVFAADELHHLTTAIDQAQQLSQRLAQQTLLEEDARSNAERLGHEAGLESGKSEAAAQLTETIKSMHDNHNTAVLDLQTGAADLAVNIVRKIAGQIQSAEWLMAQAQSAAEDLTEQSVMKLRVHPSQAEAVKAQLEKLPDSRIKQIVVDDFLPVDGCAIETSQGQINVDLDTQLSNILSLLQEDGSVLPRAAGAVTSEDLDD